MLNQLITDLIIDRDLQIKALIFMFVYALILEIMFRYLLYKISVLIKDIEEILETKTDKVK